jgi:hypothetical protein
LPKNCTSKELSQILLGFRTLNEKLFNFFDRAPLKITSSLKRARALLPRRLFVSPRIAVLSLSLFVLSLFVLSVSKERVKKNDDTDRRAAAFVAPRRWHRQRGRGW